MTAPSHRIKVVTWNVYHGTPIRTLRKVLRELLADGVRLFLVQEAVRREHGDLFREFGLEVFQVGELLVAWDPSTFEELDLNVRRLSDTPFFRPGSTREVYLDVPVVKLRHLKTGKTLKAMSYHTPSHVQFPNPPVNRWKNLKAAAAVWTYIAGHARTDALVFGGDDNVDEMTGFGSSTGLWGFLLERRTGLKLVQAPRPTLGKRRIDDFRVCGLSVRQGYVGDGGGDHKFHVREFGFAD